jgi:hypothetical protein
MFGLDEEVRMTYPRKSLIAIGDTRRGRYRRHRLPLPVVVSRRDSRIRLTRERMCAIFSVRKAVDDQDLPYNRVEGIDKEQLDRHQGAKGE